MGRRWSPSLRSELSPQQGFAALELGGPLGPLGLYAFYSFLEADVHAQHSRADGKQLCCRPGTAVKLLWPAVNSALAGENLAIEALYRPEQLSETGTDRAAAGTTKSFPTALGHSASVQGLVWCETDE
jgi:hypothetical protein